MKPSTLYTTKYLTRDMWIHGSAFFVRGLTLLKINSRQILIASFSTPDKISSDTIKFPKFILAGVTMRKLEGSVMLNDYGDYGRPNSWKSNS